MDTIAAPRRTAAPVDRFPGQRLRIALRVMVAIVGGYLAAWGVAAASATLLVAAGLHFHDAEFVGMVAGLLVYLVVLLWAIAARRVAVVGVTLVGGGAVLIALASFVQSRLA